MAGMPRLSLYERPTYSDLLNMPDIQLIDSLKSGCHDALAVLFERYRRLVFVIALRIVRDRGEAEDATQTVFLDIFRSIAQFDPAKGTVRVWILQYAYHRSINSLLHLKAHRFYDQEDLESAAAAAPVERFVFDRYTPNETRLLIQQSLAALKNPEREVIELAFSGGLTMKEIADRTGNSLVNVRHHYYRGLKKLAHPGI
jgi:RNA polymerase sigma-70 factor, ECF subfamily